jgi:predicted lipoprotein with Yx(FWY)xxD motif
MNPLSTLKPLTLTLAAAMLAMAGATAALAAGDVPQYASNGLLVAPNGMTLYTFDKDAPNKSHCAGGCLAAWPALTVKEGAALKAPFSAITRDDGSKQVAIGGKPLYFYVADQKAGDATGDKSGGVWHVVRKDSGGKTSNAAPAAGGYGSTTY